MELDRRAREYANWDLSEAPTGALEVTFDGITWHPLTREADTVRALIAGPDAQDNPVGTVVLDGPITGSKWRRHIATIRATDAPQILIRDAGVIDIT